MTRPIDPEHKQWRKILQILGPVVLGIGGLLTLVGLVSFFASFGSFGIPRYFWCAFVGIPLMGLGSTICKFAFMGTVSRYMANEVAPVSKDVVNYMADGTKDAVRDVAAAIGEGLSSSRGTPEITVLRCHKCNAQNATTANFCQACGASLGKSVACAQCGELNDPDARFCDNCGQAVA